MSQDTRPSGEPSPGDMDHFNSEVYGELVSMRELQAKLGLCMRNQEAIHQRLDSICAGMSEVVDQLNGHKESWTSLSAWIQETSHSIADLERSYKSLDERFQLHAKAIGGLQLYTDIVERPAKGNLADRVEQLESSSAQRDVAMGNAHLCLWKAVGDLQQAEEDRENDKEIERRANNV